MSKCTGSNISHSSDNKYAVNPAHTGNFSTKKNLKYTIKLYFSKLVCKMNCFKMTAAA